MTYTGAVEALSRDPLIQLLVRSEPVLEAVCPYPMAVACVLRHPGTQERVVSTGLNTQSGCILVRVAL